MAMIGFLPVVAAVACVFVSTTRTSYLWPDVMPSGNGAGLPVCGSGFIQFATELSELAG